MELAFAVRSGSCSRRLTVWVAAVGVAGGIADRRVNERTSDESANLKESLNGCKTGVYRF